MASDELRFLVSSSGVQSSSYLLIIAYGCSKSLEMSRPCSNAWDRVLFNQSDYKYWPDKYLAVIDST